ncbi:FG-GAP and VCBS repeat-containing protein [Streptomyces lasiicapitis]|uniref:FG-GAP and VCBS repeat-containing protein n=1 Tax=Streptomyces lasiicapitis TaxID=1923961 RepID=UPI00364E3B3E
MRRRALTAAAVCAAALAGATAGTTALAPAALAAPSAPSAPAPGQPAGNKADFNGDGRQDLAIGAHTATVGDVKRAGVVTIAYGSATGLKYETATILSQATPGVPGEPVADGKWREVSATGDLDGDGYDDLVVHYLQKNMVLWGGKDGITGEGAELPPGNYTADSPKLLGGGMGVGDVNGDGVDDFVSRANNGLSYGVTTLLGPLNRTTGKPAGVWHRDTGKLDKLVIGTVYVGDLTGDGTADVVASGGVVLGSGTPGGVVLKGSPDGLVKGDEFTGPYRREDSMPSAFGDLNKDGYQDLVTAYPGKNKVYVTYGGKNGVSDTVKSREYTQASAGVPGVEEAGDKFGSSVAIGDTDRDGYPDLIVGASYETGSDAATTAKSGAITVLRGSATGITTTGAASFTQNSKGIPSTSENDDHFGASTAVVAGEDGTTELYVGGNGEDGYKGRVWKLPTGASGVTGEGATSFHLGAIGGPTGGGNFGYRMAG